MIHATIRIVTSPAKRDEASAILRAMATRTTVVSGCITCRVYRDTQDDRALMIDAIWKNEEELHRHLRSEEFRKVLLVMEMAEEKPEIRFETVSCATGLETVEKARTGRISGT